LELAIVHLLKEAEKAEDRPRRGDSDPEALRALADYLQEKVDDLESAP
jgi:hypothetical protein